MPGSDPDLALASRQSSRAIHGLERSRGRERLVIDASTWVACAPRPPRVCPSGGHPACLMSGASRSATISPVAQRRSARRSSAAPALHPLHGRPGVIRHHGDHIALIHDLPHNRGRRARIACELEDRPALDGRERDECHFEFGGRTSIPKRALPSTSTACRAWVARPMSLKSFAASGWRRRTGRAGRRPPRPIGEATAGGACILHRARVAGVGGTRSARRRLNQHQRADAPACRRGASTG